MGEYQEVQPECSNDASAVGCRFRVLVRGSCLQDAAHVQRFLIFSVIYR